VSGSAHLDAASAKSFTANAVVAVTVVVAVWCAIASTYRSDLYEWDAVPASALLLGIAVAALLWRPAPKLAALRAAAILVGAQGFQSAGLAILNRPRIDDLLFAPTPAAFTASVESTALFSVSFLIAVAAGLLLVTRPLFTTPRAAGAPKPAPRDISVWAAIGFAIVTVLASVSGATPGGPFGSLGIVPLIVFNEAWIIPAATAAALGGSAGNRVVLFIALGVDTAMAAWTTMLGTLMVPMRAVLLTLIILRRRGVGIIAAAATMIFVVVNPAKTIVRSEAATHGPAATLGESADRWKRAILATWTGEADLNENLDKSARRFDYNSAGAAVFSTVPAIAGFKMGDTYAEIPYMLIPRAIMPGKRNTKDFRAKLTVEIGLQTAAGTEETAVALPAPAEAYWNFGWLGVAGVAAVLGMFAAFLYRLAPEEPVTEIAFIVLVTTTLGTFNDLMFTIVPNIVFILLARLLMPYLTRPRPDLTPVGATLPPAALVR
jgi:hypothetical protein